MNGVVSLIMLCCLKVRLFDGFELHFKKNKIKKSQDAPKQHVNISFCHQAVPGQASLCRISQISFCI